MINRNPQMGKKRRKHVARHEQKEIRWHCSLLNLKLANVISVAIESLLLETITWGSAYGQERRQGGSLVTRNTVSNLRDIVSNNKILHKCSPPSLGDKMSSRPLGENLAPVHEPSALTRISCELVYVWLDSFSRACFHSTLHMMNYAGLSSQHEQFNTLI